MEYIDTFEPYPPTISALSVLYRDALPPAFNVNTAGRRYFAVEIATSPTLLSSTRKDQWAAVNHYGSWVEGLTPPTPYVLPQQAWDSLKAASRLYYRLHVADDTRWETNYAASASKEQISSLPSILLVDEIDRLVTVKLQRFDRDPGGEHYYGNTVDRELDVLFGGANNLDRDSLEKPAVFVEDTDIRVELHEDGPLFQFVIEQIPNFLSAGAAIVSAWIAYRVYMDGKNEREQTQAAPDNGRTVQIRSRDHYYEGKPKSKEELAMIFELFDSLDSE